MLVHLSVHNYAIVEHLDLELARGMSVITGETGFTTKMRRLKPLTLAPPAESCTVTRTGTLPRVVVASVVAVTVPVV